MRRTALEVPFEPGRLRPPDTPPLVRPQRAQVAATFGNRYGLWRTKPPSCGPGAQVEGNLRQDLRSVRAISSDRFKPVPDPRRSKLSE